MKDLNKDYSRIIKRLTVVITAAVFVFGMCQIPVSAADETDSSVVDGIPSYSGYISMPEIDEQITIEKGTETAGVKKLNKKAAEDLPSQFDSSLQPYYEGYVPIQSQGSNSTCWAMAMTTVSHISFLKELYESGASLDGDYEPSWLHFAYRFYNRANYPYGGYTLKDKNLIRTEDPAFRNKTYLTIGGNNYMSAQALGNWMGMCRKSTSGPTSEANAYNDYITLQNAVFLANTTRKVDGKSIGVLNKNQVKQAIYEHGAVLAEMYLSSQSALDYQYVNQDGLKGYCCDRYDVTNHAVSIIGWDDDFKLADEEEGNTVAPEHEGAWIVQNSWGKNNSFDYNGYFYVSYDDLSLKDAVALDMQPAEAYDVNYHYDGNAIFNYRNMNMNDECANVYYVKDDGKLHTISAVGFTTWNTRPTKYQVKIYRNLTSTPTTGTLAADMEVSTNYAGIYTFDLAEHGVEPVPLDTGERFAIVVRATETEATNNAWRVGVEMAENEEGDYIKFESTSIKNRCYYRQAGESDWNGLYEQDPSASFRIKAFSTTEDKISLEGATVTLPAKNYSYTAKAIKPIPTVQLDGATLKKGTDYTVTYSNNKNPGKGTVTVKGTGLYRGTVAKTFFIAGVKGFQTKAVGKTTVKLTWKKSPRIKGYEIYRCKAKDGKYKRIKTITKNTTITFKNTKLKAGTEYKYKIRTYKKIGKKTYKGPFVDILTVKTKEAAL